MMELSSLVPTLLSHYLLGFIDCCRSGNNLVQTRSRDN